MLPTPASSQDLGKATEFRYNASELNSIVDGVGQFFAQRGYRLESGQPDNGTYGIGNNILRMLFGAFVKRYSFNVTIAMSDDQRCVVFVLAKAMSGAMGGVIGHSKMTKEYNAIVSALSAGVA